MKSKSSRTQNIRGPFSKDNSHRWPKISEPDKAKKYYKRMRYIFSSESINLSKRQEFFNAKKKYKKSIKTFQKQLKLSKLNKLTMLQKEQPKEFWKSVNNLLEGKRWSNNVIDPPQWINYFSSLLNSKNGSYDSQCSDFINSSLTYIERCSVSNQVLESPITKDEFISNLKKLKRGKANGLDSITNEMILEGGDSKRNKRKSQREAARLKRQADTDPAMEEDEEVEVHSNQIENIPDTPRVSRNNTPDPEDTIQGETDYAVVIELVNNLRDKLAALNLDNTNIRAACDALRRQCHSVRA